MAGIDNITSEILDEAQKSADEILASARQDAAGILSDAESRAAAIALEARKEAAAKQATAQQRTASRVKTLGKRQQLAARGQVIEEVIQQAYDSLALQPDDSYWEMIAKLVTRYALPKDGEIVFGEKDLTRLTDDVRKQIGAAAEKAGGTLSFAPEAGEMTSGFVLRYGGIEENCTLEALFRDAHNDMQDKVRRILWQE